MVTAPTCNRCGCRPARPERKSCEFCADKMRKTNERRREQKREWDRQYTASGRAAAAARALAKRKRNGRPSKLELARYREWQLEQWAKRNERVPTSKECAEILGLSTMGAVIVRRRAFRLRLLWDLQGVNDATIPYPVPAEFQAPTEAVWDRCRWVTPDSK